MAGLSQSAVALNPLSSSLPEGPSCDTALACFEENAADAISSLDSRAVTYYRGVRRAAEQADGKTVVVNRELDHAGILIAELINRAQQEVLILCSAVDDRAYGTPLVIEAARCFLKKSGAKFQIILEKNIPLSNSKFLTALDSSGALAGKIFVAPEAVARAYPFHFLVADDRHYRFEPNKNAPRYKVIAQFGVASTRDLRDAFEKIRAASTPYPVNNTK